MLLQTSDFYTDRQIEEGKTFSAGALDEGKRKNEKLKLLIENPTDSGRFALSGVIQLEATGTFISRTFSNVTVDSYGDLLDVTNLRLDSNVTSSVEVYDGGEYSGGTNYPPTVTGYQGGSTDIIPVLIDPGSNFLVEATIRNPGGADFSRKFTWVPVPEETLVPVDDL